MVKKRLLILVLLILAMVSVAQSRYQLSVPFQVDAGGRPVSSAKVGINISEGTTCVTPFYYNISTVAFGRGQINVSSPRLIASRQYAICINATVSSNVIRGRTLFQSPVGDINASSLRGWVNGSRARFDSFFLNNGSTFDVLYGRQNQTIAVAVIRNNTARGKHYINISIYSRDINATRTLGANKFALSNGSLFETIFGRFNNTWAGSSNLLYNNTNRGKIYFNNTLFSTRNLTFTGVSSGFALPFATTLKFYNLSSGSLIYQLFPSGNVTVYNNLTFKTLGRAQHSIKNLTYISLGTAALRGSLNFTRSNGSAVFSIMNSGNFTFKQYNASTNWINCGGRIEGNGSVRLFCNGQRIAGGG